MTCNPKLISFIPRVRMLMIKTNLTSAFIFTRFNLLVMESQGLADEGWSFNFTPYLFALGIDGDASTLPQYQLVKNR